MLLHTRPPYNFCGSENLPFEKCEVAVLPVPYDSTTSYKAGTREGPHAIIVASRNMESLDLELKKDISAVGICTLDELEPSTDSPEKTMNRVEEAVGSIIEAGKFPVMLGGEHSLTLGAVRALSKKHKKLSVLQIDAHADLREEYEGSKYNHACVMRRVREICPTVQVGIRSMCEEELEYVERKGVKGIYGLEYDYEKLLKGLTDEVYITVDLDGLDPSIMPAVGTPEPGGLLWKEVLELLRKVCENKKVVGFDVMELCPLPGNVAPDFIASKLTYKLIGYSLLLKGE
ncbi:agmatinase [Candidatus Micrarchaeota archaeon]|nr:MAG: agmatinase [Candidatus Micrarchaeota archaeon]